jgi:four helix bundle protein
MKENNIILDSSKKDFKNKLRISYREAGETNYWLRLLKEVSCWKTTLPIR